MFLVLGKTDALVIVHCREKKLAAKAQGRRHASSDDESEDEAGEEAEAGSAGEQDPFFQHEDNPFDDPFFRVWPSPLLHLSVLLICLCRCTGEMSALSILVVKAGIVIPYSAVLTMPINNTRVKSMGCKGCPAVIACRSNASCPMTVCTWADR